MAGSGRGSRDFLSEGNGARMRAVPAALIEGEDAGWSMPLDCETFVAKKQAS